MNQVLNKLDIWKDEKCVECSRSYPDTLLNIEGHIHHNTKLKCLNNKECNRYRKKKKK